MERAGAWEFFGNIFKKNWRWLLIKNVSQQDLLAEVWKIIMKW